MRFAWFIFFATTLGLGSLASAQTREIYAPQPNLLRNSGILEPSLVLGQTGLSTQMHLAGARNGGSFAQAKVAFPFHRSEEARLSGWAFGVATGTAPFSHESGYVFTPASYWWELGLGRGTTGPISGGESGIRGYFEVNLRDQRPIHTSGLDSIMAQLNATSPAGGPANFSLDPHFTAIVLRMGVANDYAGSGLVAQKSSNFLFRLQGATYFPINLPNDRSVQRTYLSLASQAMLHCGLSWLSCGVALNFIQSSNAFPDDKVNEPAIAYVELYRHLAYGLAAEMKWKEDYALRALMQWSRISARRFRAVTSPAPSIDAMFSMAF
ncbi:MAG: hypothetical protein JST16_15380 [Bdellovibrionales bacterium]|nr:hypothetical protein [Bdellovibrionales bacterium]